MEDLQEGTGESYSPPQQDIQPDASDSEASSLKEEPIGTPLDSAQRYAVFQVMRRFLKPQAEHLLSMVAAARSNDKLRENGTATHAIDLLDNNALALIGFIENFEHAQPVIKPQEGGESPTIAFAPLKDPYTPVDLPTEVTIDKRSFKDASAAFRHALTTITSGFGMVSQAESFVPGIKAAVDRVQGSIRSKFVRPFDEGDGLVLVQSDGDWDVKTDEEEGKNAHGASQTDMQEELRAPDGLPFKVPMEIRQVRAMGAWMSTLLDPVIADIRTQARTLRNSHKSQSIEIGTATIPLKNFIDGFQLSRSAELNRHTGQELTEPKLIFDPHNRLPAPEPVPAGDIQIDGVLYQFLRKAMVPVLQQCETTFIEQSQDIKEGDGAEAAMAVTARAHVIESLLEKLKPEFNGITLNIGESGIVVKPILPDASASQPQAMAA